MTKELVLEIGKSYLCREGYEYEIVCYNNYLKNRDDTVIGISKHNGMIAHYYKNGKFGHQNINSSYDLIHEVKPQKWLEEYISIWKDSLGTIIDNIEYEESECL